MSQKTSVLFNKVYKKCIFATKKITKNALNNNENKKTIL